MKEQQFVALLAAILIAGDAAGGYVCCEKADIPKESENVNFQHYVEMAFELYATVHVIARDEISANAAAGRPQ